MSTTKNNLFFNFWFVVLINLLLSLGSISADSLPPSVTSLLKKHKAPQKNISIYIRDLSNTSTLLSLNAHISRTPASTIKLLTTYAGLKQLGPNYSWKTEVWIRGELSQGVLHGDIILKGYGDPFFVEENLWKLIKGLRENGLKVINGNIIIDNSFFKLAPHDSSAFDNKPFRVYNAPSSALMYNFQATRFTIKPNKQSSSVAITPYPAFLKLKVKNKIKLVEGKCKSSYYRPSFAFEDSNMLIIRGEYAVKCNQKTITRTISTPENHIFNAFYELWTNLGGVIKGHLKTESIKKTDELFYTYHSPTLGEQIRLINKWSNNVMTTQLLLTMGAEKFGTPATIAKGRKAIINALINEGIETQRVQLENGSGLSRTSKVSAKQLGQLLEIAYKDTFMPEFLSSFPLSGIDGTLANRFKKESFQGLSRFKTGTIDFVNAISGYMLNKKGNRLAIVIIQNGKDTDSGRKKRMQRALLRWAFEK